MDENEAVEWEMENFIAPKLQQQWMDFAYVEIIKKNCELVCNDINVGYKS